jgi:hypothetical protein
MKFIAETILTILFVPLVVLVVLVAIPVALVIDLCSRRK